MKQTYDRSPPPSLVPSNPPSIHPSPPLIPSMSQTQSGPTHVQLAALPGVHQRCFVIIKPPLLALLSLIHVTCMGAATTSTGGVNFILSRTLCLCVCVNMRVCDSTRAPCFMSTWACVVVYVWLFVHLCVCPRRTTV